MTIQLNLAPNSLANLIAICEKRPNLGLDYKILSGEGAFKEVEVTMEYPDAEGVKNLLGINIKEN